MKLRIISLILMVTFLCTLRAMEQRALLQQNAQGQTPLHLAAMQGNNQMVGRLIGENRALLNAKDKGNLTALYFAIDGSHVNTVSLLLAQGDIALLDVNSEGMTYLDLAARRGNAQIVGLLLATNRFTPFGRDFKQRTVLHHAVTGVNADVVGLLLNQPGLSVNDQDIDGYTPLHIAAMRGNINIARLLMRQQPIKHNITDKRGKTPLSYAEGQAFIQIIELLKGFNAVASSSNNAASSANDRQIAQVVNGGQSKQANPLAAKRNGELKTLAIVIQPDPDPRTMSERLVNGLQKDDLRVVENLIVLQDVWRDKDEVHRIIYEGLRCAKQEQIFRLLFSRPEVIALLNKFIGHIHTPLHLVSMWGHEKVAEMLLAIPTVRLGIQSNHLNRTAFHYAAMGGHATILEMLLTADQKRQRTGPKSPEISINKSDDEGKTAMHHVAARGEVDAAVAESKRGNYLKAARFLLSLPNIDYLSKDHRGQTPLFLACDGGDAEIASLLLNKPNQSSPDKTESFVTAAWEGHMAIISLFFDKRFFCWNLNRSGTNALHAACKNGHRPVVLAILSGLISGERSKQINQKDASGYTALHHAAQGGYLKIVTLLTEVPELKIHERANNLTARQLALKEGHQSVADFLATF